MKITKWIIFKDSLFVLFYPFLAFDIFLFYDDGANDFLLVGALWLFLFLIALVFYVIQKRRTREPMTAGRVGELFFLAFEVLFFVGNAFLVGLFAYIVLSNHHQFLI
jgi:hypothetical protein